MQRLIECLYESQIITDRFNEIDKKVVMECKKNLLDITKSMGENEIEDLRDFIFYISHISKKEAFEIGFNTAVKLMIEKN